MGCYQSIMKIPVVTGVLFCGWKGGSMMDSGEENNGLNYSDTYEFLQRWYAGDEDSLNRLFEKYRLPLEHFVRKKLSFNIRKGSETYDFMSEVFIKARNALMSGNFEYRGVGLFWRWLCRIAERCIFQKARDDRRDQDIKDRLGEMTGAAPIHNDDALRSSIISEEEKRIRKALETVSERNASAYLMRMDLWMDFNEIKKECGFPSYAATRQAVIRTAKKVWKELRRGSG